MHKVSRTLLTLGVLAFGTVTAACGDKITVQEIQPITGVQSVTVTPPSATIGVNQSIQLVASVNADAATAKTVTWTSSNAAIATVDATGRVTAPATSQGGTVTIIATSTADASKQGAAAIVVTTPTVQVPPSVSINSVTDNLGNPVNLSAAGGQVNVTVNVSNTAGASRIEVFLASAASCLTNTISASDVAAASQNLSAGQNGPVTLSINTAELVANNPRFANGNYCIKARLTTGVGSATPTTVVATNTTPITLANTNQFRATVSFVSRTGGPVSAVSTINGLNYNQGDLVVNLNPVIFTGGTPVLISGYLTKNGQTAGAVCAAPPCQIAFTNQAVSGGTSSITFTDTSATGVRSIFQYTSLPAGDTLYITSASDASGNPITITPTFGAPGFAVVPGIRIDNDAPTLAAYTVTAPNGFIGAGFQFSSGTTGTSTDTKAGVPGVGGVTTRYYVGPAGSAAFTTANSCDISGLTVATTGSDLANTNNTDALDAKVIVSDALGNRICTDIASSFGPLFFFGVDKVAPTVAFQNGTAANAATPGAAANDLQGYNVSKNFNFIFNDSISGFNASTPLRGTLMRNFYTTPSAADCVIGAFNATTNACTTTDITITSNFGTPPNAGGGIEFTGGTAVVGYYTVTATAQDRALNPSSPVLTRTAAFDNIAPTIGGVTQSPAAVLPMGSVTVSATVADNFDLTNTAARLTFATAPASFQGIAGNNFGPNFDANRVTSGTATVTIPNVLRGLQSVDAANIVLANRTNPNVLLTVTDVGTNAATSAATTITTSTAGMNIQVGNTFTATPTNAAPATRQTTTNLTASIAGNITDPAFQSQPFAVVDFYRLTGGELVLQGSTTGVLVTDNATSGRRTFTYSAVNVPLTSPAAGGTTNTFYAVGRNGNGDAVISNAIVVTNP